MRERVWLGRCPDYDGEALFEKISGAFEALGVYDSIKPGMTVVLKPNLIQSSKPQAAICTHPAFTQAVGKCVQRAGGKVLIAESPGGPYSPAVMKAFFRNCGYTDMAESCGFSLYTDCKSREVSLPEGERCRRVSIVEPFLERDFLIDLPKLKTHCMVGYSGAVKNMFGAVPGLQKPELHCRFPEKEDFSKALVDICAFLRPNFSLMDGVWAMEGDGPTGGLRRDTGFIGASRSPYALDVCMAGLLGFPEGSLPMLAESARRGLGPKSFTETELLGESLEGLQVADFKRARASSTDFIDRLPGFLRPAAKKLSTPYPRIQKQGCVGCGKCAESCPQKAISMEGGRAVISYKACIRCFCCHEMCPRHVVGVKRLGLFQW